MVNIFQLFEKKETAIKISIMTLASSAIFFYSGPVASVIARESFCLGYDLLYGIPNWYNPSFSLTYMPLREHAAYYGYAYGGVLLGAVCAPLIYKAITLGINIGAKMSPPLQNTNVLEEFQTPSAPVDFSVENPINSENINQALFNKNLNRFNESSSPIINQQRPLPLHSSSPATTMLYQHSHLKYLLSSSHRSSLGSPRASITKKRTRVYSLNRN